MRPIAAILAAAAIALTGCEVDVSTPDGVERSALLAPDFVASAAANATGDPAARWLLKLPKAVRASFVREVLDAEGDRAMRATAWLLRQPDEVRESYVREVVEPALR